MKVETSRFGCLEMPDREVINMVRGPYGFDRANKFIIIESAESVPFKWLQSMDFPDLAFVIVDPVRFFPKYKVKLHVEDEKDLQLKSKKNTSIYVFVVIPSDPHQITANMLGPIIINCDNMLAKQIAMVDDRYSARYALISN